MWEFRELIGKRADAIWDEILSIADRNEGYLPGNFKRYSSLLAGVCKSTARHLDVALLWLTTPRGRHHRAWVEVNSEGVARVANFTEYHRMQEPYKILSGNKTGSLPSEPSEPSEPIKDKKKTPPLPPLAIPPWLEAEPWNQFKEHRQKLRKPMTRRAEELAFARLAKLRDAGDDPKLVVEQSILKGWQDFYPLNEGRLQSRSDVLMDKSRAALKRGLE